MQLGEFRSRARRAPSRPYSTSNSSLELDNSLVQSIGLSPVHLDASIVNDIFAKLVLKLLLDLRAVERHGMFVWIKRFILGEVVRISLGLQDLVGCVDLGLSIARV